MCSLPGKAYEESNLSNFEIFRTGNPVTSKLQTDEYETFVSASALVLDPRDGKVLDGSGSGHSGQKLANPHQCRSLRPNARHLDSISDPADGSDAIRWRNQPPLSDRRCLKTWKRSEVSAGVLALTVVVVVLALEADHRGQWRIFAQDADTQESLSVTLFRSI